DHPANEVYVTGSFDDWAKSVKLERQGDSGSFAKTVELPKSDEKVLYKFVVDGNWTTSAQAPQEDDGHGIYNNVLHPNDIAPISHIMSNVAPDSTTAKLAGEQPKATPADEIPGAFIETPAALEDMKEYAVKPIPASEGAGNPIKLAPGEPVPDSSTFNTNSVSSTVRDDPELKAKDEEAKGEQTFGVSPIPASAGVGNPISQPAGTGVPASDKVTANTVNSTVKLDKASYEKSDALPPQIGPVVTSEEGSMFDIPGVTNSTIPESSLPMGSAPTNVDPGFTIQSADTASTTAALAGLVPKEPRGVPEVVKDSQAEAHVSPEASTNVNAVEDKKAMEKELLSEVPKEPAAVDTTPAGSSVPEVVSESQDKAHAAPEASASPTAVQDKTDMESELKAKVPEEPATTENSPPAQVAKQVGETAAVVAGGLAATGAAVAGAAYVKASETAKETANKINPQVQQAINAMNSTLGSNEAAATEVPEPVSESIAQSHTSPEAASNSEAVTEKSAMESELLNKVPEDNATGESAPTMKPATVPDVVKESIAQADVAPEAATNPTAIKEKTVMENELKREVPTTTEIADPAPTESAALSATAPIAPTTSETTSPAAAAVAPAAEVATAPAMSPTALEDREPFQSSSDPKIPITTLKQTEPVVSTGPATSTVPETSGPPQTPTKKDDAQSAASAAAKKSTDETSKNGAAGSSSPEDKKKKRRSFFGKLKDKFTGHKEA
ncbi:carbohydrate-binding module family 48 protein, partial [Saccharata proteae CBS 121410]